MLIWILSGYFLLRIHKGACALHQWINQDYAWGLFLTLLEQDWEVKILNTDIVPKKMTHQAAQKENPSGL